MNPEPLPPIRDLLGRTFAFYRRYLRLIILVTFPVVAFVDVVIGAGLGELTASAHKNLPDSDLYIGYAAEAFVTVPLVTTCVARAVVLDRVGTSPPRARQVLQEGFDLFVPAFLVEMCIRDRPQTALALPPLARSSWRVRSRRLPGHGVAAPGARLQVTASHARLPCPLIGAAAPKLDALVDHSRAAPPVRVAPCGGRRRRCSGARRRRTFAGTANVRAQVALRVDLPARSDL